MDYSNLIPHLSAASNLLDKWTNKLQSKLNKMDIGDIQEFNGVKECASKIKQTINKLQLAIAKSDTIETLRLISIFYGLLYMIRPSISQLATIYCEDKPCAILAEASSKSNDIKESVLH